MSERDGYEAGVPCWVASVHPDPESAVSFYTELFGWEAEEAFGSGHFACTLRGRALAAIGPGAAPTAWRTYIWVDDADATARAATDAGGGVLAEPSELADAGRLAVLQDPAGAILCAWEPGSHRGAQLVNEPGAWSMSRLSTGDPEGAKAFYGAVFGWETDTFDLGEGGEVTLWRVPGYVGGEPEQPVSRDVVGAMSAAGDDTPPNWAVDFWVDDADAAAFRAEELGGQVLAPPFDTPVGRTAVLADPQGAAFSVSRVVPPSG